ncbi:hypothetical protein ACWD1Y_18405 [Streptomyces sp. NPDC002814]
MALRVAAGAACAAFPRPGPERPRPEAGGTGLITGRIAFQRPTSKGIELLHAVQDVYLDDSVTVA